MGVDVYLEDESGTRIDRLLDVRNIFIGYLLEREQVDFMSDRCFRFIDPYWVVGFNRIQTKVLRVEIQEKMGQTKDDGVKSYFVQLLTLVDRMPQDKGSWILWFIGD